MSETRAKCASCAAPATGTGDYPWACWVHTPEERDLYPVIVEYTHRHVVWVPADSPDDALASMQSDGYELTNDRETLADAGWTVEAPKYDSDWSLVYSDGWGNGPYRLRYDAHVETHRLEMARQKREADKAACISAGHPNREEPLSDGRRWCDGCREYLPVETVELAGVSR